MVLGGDGRLAIRQAVGAAVVDSLDVRTGDGEENAADLDVAGVLGFCQSVFQTGAGLGKVVDLTFPNSSSFCHADAKDLDGAVRLYLAHDHAGLAGADLESDMNFRTTCHGIGSIAIEKVTEIARTAVFADISGRGFGNGNRTGRGWLVSNGDRDVVFRDQVDGAYGVSLFTRVIDGCLQAADLAFVVTEAEGGGGALAGDEFERPCVRLPHGFDPVDRFGVRCASCV